MENKNEEIIDKQTENETMTNSQEVNNQQKPEVYEKKRNKYAFVVAFALVAILLITGTYAWLRIGLNGTKTNIIKAGLLDLRIDETPTSEEVIRIERAIPQSYRQGITNPPYRFTLINNSSVDTDYTISLEDLYEGADASLTANDKIADNLIRYILVKNDDEMIASNSKLLSTGRTIDTGTISGKSGNTPTEIPYTLYIWIDSKAGDNATEADIMSKIFNARLNITAEQHHETTPAQVGFQPTYFAFGDVTTASPTTAPAGKNVYAALDSQGNKGVCINRSGTVHCFQTNNVAYEQQHVQQVFNQQCEYLSEYSCWICNAGLFGCAVGSNGDVSCNDRGPNEYCAVSPDGSVNCGQ